MFELVWLLVDVHFSTILFDDRWKVYMCLAIVLDSKLVTFIWSVLFGWKDFQTTIYFLTILFLNI